MPERQVSGAILVGGRARRLGGQAKPALRVGARTILERQIEALRHAGLTEILLVGRWHGEAPAGTRAVSDATDEGGALAGLYSALLAAATPVVIVLAGDMPFVSGALIARLAAIGADEDAVVPRTADGWHPLCASYRRALAPVFKARLDAGAWRVTEALTGLRVRELADAALAAVDDDRMLLMNVNTPDDHRQAERRAAARA